MGSFLPKTEEENLLVCRHKMLRQNLAFVVGLPPVSPVQLISVHLDSGIFYQTFDYTPAIFETDLYESSIEKKEAGD